MELKSGTPDRKLSQSLSNLPKVMITDSGNKNLLLDNFEEFKTRSQPCSPRVKRRAFTTCIAGTRYIIGRCGFILFVCLSIEFLQISALKERQK